MVEVKPNITFIQLRKKKIGPSKYNSNRSQTLSAGARSIKKLKNNVSAIKNSDPGNPKNNSKLNSMAKNNLGHKKFIPLISVISLVLKRRFTASTNKNEFVDNIA